MKANSDESRKPQRAQPTGAAKRDFAVSLVIVAHQMGPRMVTLLDPLVQSVRSQKGRWEIIVVDDGSSDSTSQEAAHFERSYEHFRVVRHNSQRGLGECWRTAMEVARGEVLLFAEADDAIPTGLFSEAVHSLRTADVILSSSDSFDFSGSRSLLAPLSDTTYHAAARWFLAVSPQDLRCRFSGYRREAALKVARLSRVKGPGARAEWLALGQSLKLNIQRLVSKDQGSVTAGAAISSKEHATIKDLLAIRDNFKDKTYDKQRKSMALFDTSFVRFDPKQLARKR